jgi:outer membrane protein TolC
LQATTISYQAQAMQEYAESAGRAAEAEKAKFLPRAGVFGESNLYSGSRNTATAYNVGFYVQMSLYNGEDIGSYDEARLKGEAAKEKALDQIRKESAKKKELLAMERALTKQLTLLENSTKLMEEQVTNSRRLFTNGSINAIQMSEILSRSADLLIEKANANREYILVRSQLYTLFSN